MLDEELILLTFMGNQSIILDVGLIIHFGEELRLSS